jgi:2-polyprenyl-3-methyl-5-hydroxy-6-metoxy-1,4-benzoquinol methylase
MKTSGLNEFYGSDPQLRAYHARYLDWLTATPSDLPILDLGCGSGVFLELVRERQRTGRGIELMQEASEIARSKGLDVVQADVVQFLKAQSPSAYSGIYCSHLIEHFSYSDACWLLEECRRVLAPSGRLVVITPNPVSLDVISETFWLDPTHVRPYPLPLLERMMQRAGFEIVGTGHDDPPRLPRRTLPRRWFLRLLLGKHYGAMNTFVVGQTRAGS